MCVSAQNPEALEQTLMAQGAVQQCAELRFAAALQQDSAASSQLQKGPGAASGDPALPGPGQPGTQPTEGRQMLGHR